jgi:hypothetical protein
VKNTYFKTGEAKYKIQTKTDKIKYLTIEGKHKIPNRKEKTLFPTIEEKYKIPELSQPHMRRSILNI